MRGQVVGHPGQADAHGHVQARGDEDATGVLGAGAVLRRAEQDGVAGAGGDAAADGEHTPAGYAVRVKGHAAVGQGADGVAGDGQEVSVDAAVAQRGDDGGQEDGVAVEHDGGAKLGDAEDNDLPVGAGGPYLVPLHAAVLVRVEAEGAPVEAAADLDELFLLGAEPRGREGIIGQDKVGAQAEEDGGDALEDEDPAPGVVASGAIHEADAVGEQAAGEASDGGGGEHVEDADTQLGATIPKGQVEVDAGEEAGLEQAQQQAEADELALVVDEAGAHTDEAPGEGGGGDEVTGPHLLEEDVDGQLEDDIGDKEDGHAQLVVVAGHAQVLLHAVQARVANVDTVEKGHDIEGDEDGEQPQIKLAHQLLGSSLKVRREVLVLVLGHGDALRCRLLLVVQLALVAQDVRRGHDEFTPRALRKEQGEGKRKREKLRRPV